MKQRIFIAIISICLAMSAMAQRVYLLNIDNEIDATAWRYTARAIKEVKQSSQPYELMLIRLNTYGGEVDMATLYARH